MVNKAATVSLRHVTWVTDGEVHFYDGSLKVTKGVVAIPLNRKHWFMKAWFDGYRIEDATGRHIDSVEEFVAFHQGEAGVSE